MSTGRRTIAALCCSALLCAAACGSLKQAADAHRATLDMLREDLAAHEAMSECVQKLDAGASEAEIIACALAAAAKVRTAAEATQCQVEAVDSLIEAVEAEPVPDAGSSVPDAGSSE